MTAGAEYWMPICEVAMSLRCWSRARILDGASRWTTDWGQLLIVPTEGYLENRGGPWPIRQFEWVQLSTLKVRGGLAGRALEFVDIADKILVALSKVDCVFETRNVSWSIDGVFDDRPLVAFHIPNPFFGPVAMT